MTQNDEIGDLVEALQLLQRHTIAATNRILDQVGLGLLDLRVLLALSAEPGQTPGAVSRTFGVTSGTTTALLDRLEQRHLISRTPRVDDRRSLALYLTVEGLAITNMVQTRLRDLLTASIPDPQVRPTVDALHRVAAALRSPR